MTRFSARSVNLHGAGRMDKGNIFLFPESSSEIRVLYYREYVCGILY